MSTSDDSASPHVLLIDDDRELAALLHQSLGREGMHVSHAADAASGLAAVASAAGAPPSLVLLDLMLPDLPGIELFRRLRERAPKLPVIMLTAKGDQVDRIVGLELGADDYVAKPFDPRELVARIRAVLRRVPAPADAEAASAPLRQSFGAVVLDLRARTLTRSEHVVELTSTEFKLLVELARHPDTPVSRDTLMRAVQSHNYRPLERAVDVQVARLRRKLRDVEPGAAWILTARGEGYVWAPPVAP